VSRAVSADFVVCVCPLVRLTRTPSTLSALAECRRGTSVFTDPFAAVLDQRSSTCCSATTLSARSVRSFFSACDRASTRPFVDARGPLDASALGRDPPDTDKICSIVLRDSSPLHNQNYAWP